MLPVDSFMFSVITRLYLNVNYILALFFMLPFYCSAALRFLVSIPTKIKMVNISLLRRIKG